MLNNHSQILHTNPCNISAASTILTRELRVPTLKTKKTFFRENNRTSLLSEGIINRSARPPSIRPCKISIYEKRNKHPFREEKLRNPDLNKSSPAKSCTYIKYMGLILDQIVEGIECTSQYVSRRSDRFGVLACPYFVDFI